MLVAKVMGGYFTCFIWPQRQESIGKQGIYRAEQGIYRAEQGIYRAKQGIYRAEQGIYEK